MTTKSRAMFYQPVFGNDNGFVSVDMVDVAAFSAPSLRRVDVANVTMVTEQPAPAIKLSK